MNQSPIALGLVRLMMQLDWISSGTEILVWAPSFIWLAQLNGSSIAIVSSRFHIQTKLSVFLLAKLQSWFESSTSHVLIRLYNYMKTSEWRNHCILYYILISVSSCVVYQELLRLGLVFSIIFLVLLDFHKLESHMDILHLRFQIEFGILHHTDNLVYAQFWQVKLLRKRTSCSQIFLWKSTSCFLVLIIIIKLHL